LVKKANKRTSKADLQSRLEKLYRCLEIGRAINSETDLDRLLQLVMEETTNLMEADRSSLFLVDRERGELWSKVAQGLESREIRIPLDKGIAGHVATTGEVVNIADAYQDPRFNPEVDRKTGYRTRSILCLPVYNHSREIMGVIQVLNKKDGSFSQEDERLLSCLADQVAVAVEDAFLVREMKSSLERTRDLLEVGKAISGEIELDSLLRLIMEKTSHLLRADRSTVFLLDMERKELWSKVAQGLQDAEIRFPMHLGIAGSVATTGETINIADAYQDPRFNPEVDRKTGYRTRSILTMPMRNKRGEIIGVFQCLNKEGGGAFTREDEELLEALSSQAAIAIENAQLYEEQKKQFNSIIEVLASSIDARDPYTAGHSRRVMEYTVGTAQEMNFSRKGLEALRVAAFLHDYGKIGVHDAILRKPGNLTPEEYRAIQEHVVKTKEILENLYLSRDLREIPMIAAFHHERIDGTGYPFHLRDEEIPLGGKIMAVADVFDALTSQRPYRSPSTPEEAFAVLEEGVGKHFDGEVVAAFKRYFYKKKQGESGGSPRPAGTQEQQEK
jgi:HD-GYP domain-containing protein (c-di-GMP phosphodiesterase class II)